MLSTQATLYAALKQELAKKDPNDREKICANFLSDVNAGLYSPAKHLQKMLIDLEKIDPEEYARALPVLKLMIEINEEIASGIKKV